MNASRRLCICSVSTLALAFAVQTISDRHARPVVAQVRDDVQDEGGEQPPDRDRRLAMAARFNRAYVAKEWAQAIEFGLALARLDPEEHVIPYNLACVYALNGEAEPALAWLEKAAERGFSNLELFRTDNDLKSLRDHPGYREALDRVEKNYRAYLESVRKDIGKSEPVILRPPHADPAEPLPVVVALHPYGGTPEAIAGCWSPAVHEAGAVLVAPRAIHPVGRGYAWGATEDASMLVWKALERVREVQAIDESRVIITGFSQGGSLALSLAMHHPGKFRGAVPVGAEYMSLAFPEDVRRPRFFLLVGEGDKRLMSNRRARLELEEAGVEVHLKVVPGLGHAFPDCGSPALRQALAYVLPR